MYTQEGTTIHNVTVTSLRPEKADAFGALPDGTCVYIGRHIYHTRPLEEGVALPCYLEHDDKFAYPRVSRVATDAELGATIPTEEIRRLKALLVEKDRQIEELQKSPRRPRVRPGQPEPTRKSHSTMIWEYPEEGKMYLDVDRTLAAINLSEDDVMEITWSWPRWSVEYAVRTSLLTLPSKGDGKNPGKMSLEEWHSAE